MARVRDSSGYLLDVIERVPVMVIPCIRGRLADLEDAAGFFGSIHPAIWSFALALRSRGLGSVWTTFHLAHERETAELLGIRPNVSQAARCRSPTRSARTPGQPTGDRSRRSPTGTAGAKPAERQRPSVTVLVDPPRWPAHGRALGAPGERRVLRRAAAIR